MRKKTMYRIVTLVMSVALCIGLMPTQASAWVGPVVDDNPTANVEKKNHDGWQVAQLKNDYVTFEIALDGNEKGKVARTVPTRNYSGSLKNSYGKNNYQKFNFYAEYKKALNKTEKHFTDLHVFSVKINDYKPMENSLVLRYDFVCTLDNGKQYNLEGNAIFQLVEMKNGVNRGAFEFPADESRYDAQTGGDKHGKTWGINAQFNLDTGWNFPYKGVDVTPLAIGHVDMECRGMPKWGHENTNDPGKMMASRGKTFGGKQISNLVSINNGIDVTREEHDYTEAGTVTYDEANPFVVFDSNFTGESDGIDSKLAPLNAAAGPFSYKPDEKTLYAKSIKEGAGLATENQGEVFQMWGYRNLYKNGETPVPLYDPGELTASEFSLVDTSALSLAIIPDEKSSTGYQVKEVKAKESVPSNAAAVYRGTVTYDPKNKYYEFKDKVNLSPTVTATFSGGYFRLKKDGSVQSKEVKLSSPNFCFFMPKGGDAEPKFSYDSNKLVVELDPDNNNAVISTGIPWATAQLEKTTLDVGGKVIFSGKARIATLFDNAQLELKELEYKMNSKNQFGVNGFYATLDVDDVSLFGIGINKAKGSINTINNEYKFEVDVDAYDMFQFKGNLELQKTKDGTLMPNKLYGYYKQNVTGIPITPPLPIFEINGGGVGFDNLVKTVNGDYIGLPPINLSLTASGKMLKVMSGDLTLTAGPTGLSLAGEKLSIFNNQDLKLIDKAETHFFIEGMNRTHNGKEYKGINFNGGAAMKAGFMKTGVLKNVIDIEGSIDMNAFGGVYKNGSEKKLYLLADSTGKVNGNLKFPADWTIIGGKTLAGATALLSMGLNTTVNLNDTTSSAISSAVNNLNGYLGVCAQASLLGVYGRVYYIVPDTIGGSVHIGDPGEFKVSDFMKNSKPAGSIKADDAAKKDEAGVSVYEQSLEKKETAITNTGKKDDAPAERTMDIELKDAIGENDTLILKLDTAENRNVSKADFETTKIDGTQVKEIVANDKGENTNNGNMLFDMDESNNVKSANILLDKSKNSWKLTTSVPLKGDPELITSSPEKFEKLGAVSFNKNTRKLNVSAINLNKEEEYEIHAYLGKEKEAGEYSACEPIKIGANDIDNDGKATYEIDVPNSGEAAESGDYYVSVSLIKPVKGDFDNNGQETVDESAQIALDRWHSNETFKYTNSNEPNAPRTVSAQAAGNENLTCSFSEVNNIDGYRIRIFKDGVDTGHGYDLPVKDGKIVTEGMEDAISYSEGVYSVRIAPTANVEPVSENGEQAEGLEPLTPGSGYTIGVSTYKNQSGGLETDEGDNKDFSLYSVEKFSSEVGIAKYEEAQIGIKVNGKTINKDDKGMYNAVVSPAERDLTVTVESAGTYKIEADLESADDDVQDKLSSDSNKLESRMGDFEGNGTYVITVTNKDTKDKTNAFLKVSVDNVAPLLQVDQDSFRADKNGKFTVTGTTEEGATVNGLNADKDGRFKVEGTAEEPYGILKTRMITYLSRNSYEEDIADEKAFNKMKLDLEESLLFDTQSFTITPAKYEGPKKYKVDKVVNNREPYSQQRFNELKEDDSVTNVSDESFNTEEIAEEAIESCRENLDTKNQTLTVKTRKVDFFEMKVTARDESGNTTEVPVTILPYVAKDPTPVDPKPVKPEPKAHEHSYGKWVVTKQPTVFEKGEEKRKCNGCSHEETRAINKLKATIKLSVGKIKVNKTTVPMQKKQKFNKIGFEMARGDKAASAKSNKKKIVTASVKKGKILLKAGKKTGKAVITATTKAGAKTTFKVKVQKGKVKAKKIVGFKSKVTIKKNKKYTIPKDVDPVTTQFKAKYKSAKKKIAAVSAKGVITGKKKGKTTVTVTIGKKKYKCKVTVK